MDVVADIVSAVQAALPAQAAPYALHEPYMSAGELEYVSNCLSSGSVSSIGNYVTEFEQAIAKQVGAKYAIATVNGTAALHLAILMAGITPGDEVLTSALSFIATSNAISYCQGIPHFVDVESRTLGICPDKLQAYLQDIATIDNGKCYNRVTGSRIVALCAVHVLGISCDLAALAKICQRYHLQLIEDAAQALGSTYQNLGVGHYGLCGALSFNGNKIITSGGGGMLLTDDARIAKNAKHLSTVAKQLDSVEYLHDAVGYNYRMPNLNAALGLAQLQQLPKILQQKQIVHARYQQACSKLKSAALLSNAEVANSNHWLNALLLEANVLEYKNDILIALNDCGILARGLWKPHHQLAMYKQCPRMPLTTVENLYARLICLPSSALLAAGENHD